MHFQPQGATAARINDNGVPRVGPTYLSCTRYAIEFVEGFTANGESRYKGDVQGAKSNSDQYLPKAASTHVGRRLKELAVSSGPHPSTADVQRAGRPPSNCLGRWTRSHGRPRNRDGTRSAEPRA